MRKTDILIIGGGPAGLVAAITARKNNPDKKIILAREDKKCVIPCGLPYIFNRLKAVEKDITSDKIYQINKIDLIIGQIIKIETGNKKVILKNNKGINYDKLILATGSSPAIIPIRGIELDGVYQIRKDIGYLKNLRNKIIKAKNIVIIGGGFIGVELAEELSALKNKNISIVEILDHCLIANFDKKFALAGEERIVGKGVKLYLKTAVEEIIGKDKVEKVKLNNGKKITADLVIMAVGARPNINLAEKAKIKTAKKGGILVNKFMQTNIPDIFAIGDCAETKNFFTKKNNLIMLASVACYEARIAGANLYHKTIKNNGTVAAFSTFLNGLVLGSVGLNEREANKGKIKIVIGQSATPNHHPGTLPNTEMIRIKLIFSQSSKTLLGGQIVGPESVAEMINLIAVAIQQRMTAQELANLQVATHPLLTAAPTVYPIIEAAQKILKM
ncbi:MAG: FAD-dependent oxidoreductase [Xanthomonadaceae bacterium]|nr:FAD-dependent oxidoreductase [Rhodospirillaceae bacterium]NIA17581.1 FAD-dependent oxidoreductase [Xanthomonadaceae bacterium]